jgi:hypothetical protein
MQFFTVCEWCGCTDYTNVEVGDSNGLMEDGSMLTSNDWEFVDEENILCHDCEKPLKPILFKDVGKAQRKKIYKMDEETKMNWVKSLRIVDELEEDNEEEIF